jgi:pSer/pThr/pTyr-binding forkhead associated (FHA) protein
MTPPEVKLQDFGSLNGTFLNGEKIGQRDREISYEQARDEYHQEFILRDGDVLGLGKSCELKLVIEAAEEPRVSVNKVLLRGHRSNGTGTEIERLAGELAAQFCISTCRTEMRGLREDFYPHSVGQ